MIRFRGWVPAVTLLLACADVRADNWPQWRGPGGTGVIGTEYKLPVEWNADNVKWKLKIPGQGWSSPVVWGGRTFVTTAVPEQNRQPGAGNRESQPRRQPGGRGRGGEPRTPPNINYRWEVYCIDNSTGKVLWKQAALEGRPRLTTHRSNTYASETPVTDGKHLYVYFGMMGLFCYDLDGKLIWKKDLGLYPMRSGWGTSSSPVLLGDRLFLQIDNEKDSFLVALDKKTGNEVWRVKRDELSTWSTPFIWKNRERTELVTGGTRLRSYDPETGKLLWELGMAGGRSSASATADEETLYVGNEFRDRDGPDQGGGVLFAVKAGGSGTLTDKDVAWSQRDAAPSMASPLLYQGYLYVLDRRTSTVNCYDAKTGKPAYQRQRLGSGAFWSSPWAYDGKVFCLDDQGETFVLQPGPTFKVLARNKLQDQFWASVAVAEEGLLLRGVEYLYCVEKK